MKCKCAVTFEFDTAPPLTWEGEVVAGEPQTVVHRAVNSAKKAYPNVKWSSLVVVILERDNTDTAEVTTAPAPAPIVTAP